jgi:hypothetical protein
MRAVGRARAETGTSLLETMPEPTADAGLSRFEGARPLAGNQTGAMMRMRCFAHIVTSWPTGVRPTGRQLRPRSRRRGASGFAIVDLLFVCGIIGIISAIALPRLLLARQSAGAASAIASLRLINSAQLAFAISCGGGFFAPDLVTLGRRPPGSAQGFLQDDLGAANTLQKAGYVIQVSTTGVAASPTSCNGAGRGQLGWGYKSGADALEPSNPRSFASNADGTIWEHTAPLFAIMPETGEPAVGYPINR